MSIDKQIPLNEAIQLIPARKATLAFGGVTLYRRPVAFALALAVEHLKSQRFSDLTILNFTASIETDLLIAHGMIHTIRTCYFGLESFGLAPYFTAAAGQGKINIVEETEASIAYGLRAELAGVGFMPSHAWQGTDLFKLRPDVKTIQDPYSGEELTAFPALSCDIAVIHALEADSQGNARIGGNWGVDPELALVADRLIITTESIVPHLPQADIISPLVDAVIHTPQGAWPASCHPLYAFDGDAILDYLDCAGSDAFDQLIAEWCQKHAISYPGQSLCSQDSYTDMI